MAASRSTLRGFLRVLWVPLVASLPVAAMFGTLDYLGWLGYWLGYKIALVFAYPIMLLIWVTNSFIVPRLAGPAAPRRRRIWLAEVLPTSSSAVAGALLAVLILEAIQRGSIGDLLSVAQILMFTIYFVALALAASYAVSFYRDSVERARTDAELESARQLQRTLLGRTPHEGLGLDLYAAVVPSRQVSGDFYDIIPTADGAFVIAIADVAGERMPAALLASALLASLRTESALHPSTAEIVRRVNALACRGGITEEAMFATLFVARFDPRTMRLSYTNAGHRHPVVFGQKRDPVRLVTGGTIVGIQESMPYAEDSIALQPGDRLLIYTDGVIEAASRNGEHFGEDRLCALVGSAPLGRRSRDIAEETLAKLREFQAGAEAHDDLVLLVAQAPS